MQHKRILSLLIAFLFFGRLTHLQATQSNLSSKDKKVVLPTLALMFLHNKLSNLSSDTTKDKLQLKRVPFSKRSCLDGAFQPLHTLPSSIRESHVLAKDILTPRPGDKVRLITGKMAQIKAVAPITKNNKAVSFSYMVALNERITKRGYDEHLAGLQSRLARCERQLALGDVVLVKNDAKIVILDASEDDLKPLDTKEITLNPGSVQKANPIGKVVYLDGAWVGLMQANTFLSLPTKTKTNSKHSDEKVEDKPLEKQQLGTKRLSRQARWLVPTSHIQCILNREKRYKVYELYDKHGKFSGSKKHDLGLRYSLAVRSQIGNLIYQPSTSKLMRRMAHFTDQFTHNVLLQGHSTQVLGTEQELLLPAHADGSLPSPLQALASGSLSLYTLSNKPNKDKAWNKYTYVLRPTATAYTAKLSLSVAHHKDEQTHNLLLPKNSALQPFFWCDKKTIPCCYGVTLKQTSQPLVLSFANERDRRIFYHALVWLTSPYVLAIEEVNNQPTGHTRLLACADIKKMTLKQLAYHMQTQWMVREGTLHQQIDFLDPHFTFEKHQQQSLSKYYGWSPEQRYKKVQISLYRISKPDCIARFGSCPQLGNQGKTANICPTLARSVDLLKNKKDLSPEKLYIEDFQDLCPYVGYLSGKNNDYTFEQAKNHITNHYHGKPTPCPNQSKCPYATLTTHQAQCHRLLYSHAPRRTRAPQNLSTDYSPFKSQEDPIEARESQYQPSLMEVQCWDSTNGYLQQFMHEQIKNNYLYLWTSHQPSAFRNLEPYYKKLLAYKKDDPSTLKLSLDCLTRLKTIYHKFKSDRHQHMGYPLTMTELAALYAYTAWKGLCKDFNNALRKGDYHKWRWMDGLLHKGITKLSFLEDGNYPLYTGFKNIRLKKTRKKDQRWSDYTSSSYNLTVAERFHGNNGMKITIAPSMRQSNHIPCCDVSWISDYPDEGEVLFARGTAGHTESSIIGIDGWEVKVTGEDKKGQQISVWYEESFQQVANHPLSMRHQLFGNTQMFAFIPANYCQLSTDILSGEFIAINQMLGIEKDSTLLYIAAQNGHTDVVKVLLGHDNIKINLQTNLGESPLYIVARNGHKEVVKLLLDHDDIEINLHDQKGRYPLWIATYFGRTDVVKLLLQRRNINVNLQQNTTGAPPLYVAAQNGHTDVLQLLLDHDDINVNLQENQGASPLLIAAQNGHTAVVILLLGHEDIEVNLQRENGTSALFIAAQNGHTDIVKFLLDHDHINVNLQQNSGGYPLYIAVQEGHTDIVKFLLKHSKIKVNLQYKRQSPLFCAAQNGHTDIVKLLLRHSKIKVNLQIDDGRSPLFMAAQNGHTAVVKLLLDHDGIDINLQEDTGGSPLFMAAQQGHTDIVQLLLKHDDIKVNLQDEQGGFPLLIAAQHGHTDIVKLLLVQPGIQVNLATKKAKLTPRDAVYLQMKRTQDPKVWYKYNILRKLLIEKGGTLLACANLWPQPPLRPSNQQGLNLDRQIDNKTSLLYIAAQNGHTDVVARLLKHPKINVNFQSREGYFALYIAAQNGHTAVVTLLLDHNGIDVNLGDQQGRSPLFRASANGHIAIVRLLLAKHAQVNLATINVKITPLDTVYYQMDETQDPAVWDKYHAIWQLLIEKGAILIACANDWPQPPLRPSNQQALNVDRQTDSQALRFLMAAQEGQTDVVKLLLNHDDISVNLQMKGGASALYVAAQNGHTDIVKLLLRHPKIKVNLQAGDATSALYMAAQNGYTDVVKFLLDHDDININLQTNSGASPLFISAQNGHTDIVKLLLAQPGIQVNLATKNPKFTPRDIVYNQMQTTQNPKVWDKYYTIRQLLIEKGGTLLYYANAYPQPPLRPSNQQGLNVDMQTLFSLFQNFG